MRTKSLGIDRFADLEDFLVGQVLHPTAVVDAQLVGNLESGFGADPMDVSQRDNHALVGGDIHPGNTSHLLLLLHGDVTLAFALGMAPIS